MKSKPHKHSMNSTSTHSIINGLDTGALRATIAAVAADPTHGRTHWNVASEWRGGARSDTHVSNCTVGRQQVPRDFTLRIDEPLELCGTNHFANPQEYLLAGLNACMIVTYTAYCALEGITLDELRIETEGEIDLRGLFGLDPTVRAGYDQLRYTVHIRGDGTPEQFKKIHRTVMATSPNYFNLARAIPLHSRLVIGTEAKRQAA